MVCNRVSGVHLGARRAQGAEEMRVLAIGAARMHAKRRERWGCGTVTGTWDGPWAATTPLSSAESAFRLPQLEISQQGWPFPIPHPHVSPAGSKSNLQPWRQNASWVLARA